MNFEGTQLSPYQAPRGQVARECGQDEERSVEGQAGTRKSEKTRLHPLKTLRGNQRRKVFSRAFGPSAWQLCGTSEREGSWGPVCGVGRGQEA